MRKLYDGDTIEIDGRSFTVAFPYDDFGRVPGEDDDGVGIVSEWTTRDKAPGERELCADRRSKRFYDFAATMRKARKDGWGLTDDDKAKLAAKLGREPKKGDIIAEAVERDFDRMRRFCNDQWSYVGVVVTDDETGERDSVWGVESDCDEYLSEIAHDMARSLNSQHAETLALAIAADRPDLAPQYAED